MKVRNYEKRSCIYILIVITIILELIGVILLIMNKTYEYEKITGLVVKKDLVVLIINKEEKNILYKNAKLFFENKELKYNIVENRGKILTNKDKYYEVLINFRFDNKYKANDVLELSLKKEKHRLIEIFKIVWEGG